MCKIDLKIDSAGDWMQERSGSMGGGYFPPPHAEWGGGEIGVSL